MNKQSGYFNIQSMLLNDPFLTFFEPSANAPALPEKFTFLINGQPHPLCRLAAEQLQHYLSNQDEWQHNFGLLRHQEGTVIGKMFGVLVVKTQQYELGYLAAFSGKLAGGNDHACFVPPIYDALTENSFLNNGMQELARINQEIAVLQSSKEKAGINELKAVRKMHSTALQQQLFDQYHFLNRLQETKSLRELFQEASYKNPPSGAGECAAPKLLQYAFRHELKPVALAEFWWGQSPKSAYWKHGHFYDPCQEKCAPILAHMLHRIDD